MSWARPYLIFPAHGCFLLSGSRACTWRDVTLSVVIHGTVVCCACTRSHSHLGSASCPFWPLALAHAFLQCLTSCPRFHGSETSVLAFVLPHKSVATVRSYVCSTFYLLGILHVFFFFFKRILWSCFYECCY